MKLGKNELNRRMAVSTNTYNLMVVLDEHLRKEVSDAEKLATIDQFMRGWMTMAEMDMQHYASRLSAFVAE
jgi:hypothetical protein